MQTSTVSTVSWERGFPTRALRTTPSRRGRTRSEDNNVEAGVIVQYRTSVEWEIGAKRVPYWTTRGCYVVQLGEGLPDDKTLALGR